MRSAVSLWISGQINEYLMVNKCGWLESSEPPEKGFGLRVIVSK